MVMEDAQRLRTSMNEIRHRVATGELVYDPDERRSGPRDLRDGTSNPDNPRSGTGGRSPKPQRSAYQDQQAAGLMTLEELGSKLAKLDETRRIAAAEFATLDAREQRAKELEADRDILLDTYAEIVPEALDSLSGEGRSRVYEMLQLEVRPHPGGMRSAGRFVVSGRRANIVEDAVRAVWLSGLACSATVEDQEVGEDGPVFLRHYLHEILFDLHGISTLREAEPVRDAADVGVDDDAFVHAEGVAKNDVGRLAADSGQRHELPHGARNLSGVLLHEGAGHAPQGAGLVTVETRGTDVLLELLGGGVGVVFGLAVLREEALRHPVHLHIRGLGREHGRHQELEGV